MMIKTNEEIRNDYLYNMFGIGKNDKDKYYFDQSMSFSFYKLGIRLKELSQVISNKLRIKKL